MASTYVNDLRLEEIATGEQSGTWGDTTNTNLELIAEAFSFGTEAITTNADTHTTTIADGATDPGRSMFLKYTGTLDSACTITIAPNTVSKLWFIENGTSGSQNIIISQGSGANITIPPGDTKAIYSDGAGSGAAMVDAFASLSVVDLKVQDDLTVTDDASVGGDLLVSGEVQTANIGFTDGDNAMVIADGGAVTFPIASVFTGGFQSNGAINVGVDDTGYDVKFFGDTASAYMLWDASADDLILGGGSTMGIGAAPSLGTNGFGLYVKAPSGSESIVKIDTSSTSEEAKIQFANNGTDNWRVETNSSNDMLFIRSGVATYFKLAADGAISTPTAGTSNVRLGVNAGDAIASGTNYNVLIGDEAGTDLNSGDENTAVGFKALFEANSGSNNVAIGSNALRDLTTGTFNIAIGSSAMNDGIVTGNHNLAIGFTALKNLTGGIGNTAIGNQALEAVTVGNNSVAIGYQSFEANGASEQTGLGNFSGQNNTGAEQVFVGYSAGKFVTTGTSQTFVGHKAGLGITGAKLTGANNTAIGKSAGLALQGSAAGNTFLGKGAGQNVTTGDSNIILGNGINAASATADGQLNIGDMIYGTGGASASKIGIGTNAPSDNLEIDVGASNTGLTLTDNGDNYFPQIKLDSNRGSAGQGLGKFSWHWNGTEVARIEGAAGVDDTNKDDGSMLFNTRASGASMATQMTILHDGTVSVDRGNLVIGTAGKGVDFAAANTGASTNSVLDDYEEGTYVPTITTGSGSVALDGSFNTLSYIKVGGQVTIQGRFRLALCDSASGIITMTIPFQNKNGTEESDYANLALITYNVDYTGGTIPFAEIAANNSFSTWLGQADNAPWATINATGLADDDIIYVTGTYFTAE